MLTLEHVQDEILEHLDDQLAQPVYRGGVPTLKTLLAPNGIFTPYVVVQFGDIYRGASRGFVSTRDDTYVLPINVMAVAPPTRPRVSGSPSPDPSGDAEAIRLRVVNALLGFSPEYGGQLTKRGGSGVFAIAEDSGAIAAFVAPTSFQCIFQMGEIDGS